MTSKSIKELSLWLKDAVTTLTDDEEYIGEWQLLDKHYALVVLWEEGWGEEERVDVIQSRESTDWGLCAGIKVYNPDSEFIEEWFYPWYETDEGVLLTKSVGISPREDFDQLAKNILKEYDKVKELVPAPNGQVDSAKVLELEVSVPVETEDESEGELNEDTQSTTGIFDDINYISFNYKDAMNYGGSEDYETMYGIDFISVVDDLLERFVERLKSDGDWLDEDEVERGIVLEMMTEDAILKMVNEVAKESARNFQLADSEWDDVYNSTYDVLHEYLHKLSETIIMPESDIALLYPETEENEDDSE